MNQLRRIKYRVERAVYRWRERRVKSLLRKLEGGCRYVQHCRAELAQSFTGEGPDRWMAEHLELMLMLFAMEGHSGMSAPYAAGMFKRLALFEPIGPLTGEDHEWGEPFDSDGTQQNKRCSHVFRLADGRAYDIDGKVFREPNGYCYTNGESRVFVTFPYTPTTEYVDVPATA